MRINPDVTDANVLGEDEKRLRKPTFKPREGGAEKFTYLSATNFNGEIDQRPSLLHVAFAAGIGKRPHRDNMPPPPKRYSDLEHHPYGEQFKTATQAEVESLAARDTFDIVPLNTARYGVDKSVGPILPLLWVFTYKFNAGGYFEKCKARICVRGDLQTLDNKDTYAATLAFRTFRSLMAMVAAFGLITRQMDAITAFLNALLNELIYCYMPDGFRQPNCCLRLRKALYGLRRSPLLWLRELSTALTDLGLSQIPGEPCLFTDYRGIILFFYVDDIVGISTPERSSELDALLEKLKARFSMKDLGELKWFLGVRILQDKQAGKLWLC